MEKKASSRSVAVYQEPRAILNSSSKDTISRTTAVIGSTPWSSLWYLLSFTKTHWRFYTSQTGKLSGDVVKVIILASFKSLMAALVFVISPGMQHVVWFTIVLGRRQFQELASDSSHYNRPCCVGQGTKEENLSVTNYTIPSAANLRLRK